MIPSTSSNTSIELVSQSMSQTISLHILLYSHPMSLPTHKQSEQPQICPQIITADVKLSVIQYPSIKYLEK